MDAARKAAKRRLKDIKSPEQFLETLNSIIISDEDKAIMLLAFVYLQDYNSIATLIGMSESNVKKRMRKVLDILK